MEEGLSAHYMGYLPSYMLVRTARRMLVDQPPVVGTLVAAAGFAWARLRREPQVDDEPARRAVRREQRGRIVRLLGGRSAAPLERLPGGGPAFWDATEQPPPEDPFR